MRGFKKRFIACLLIIATLITAVPITYVHADDTGVANNDNKGDEDKGTSASSASHAWRAGYSGYRFYVIDSNFQRVSTIHDYWFAADGSYPTGGPLTRFDVAGVSPTTYGYNSIDKLNEITNSDLTKAVDGNSPLYPIISTGNGGTKLSQGANFADWFLADELADLGLGLGQTQVEGGDTGGGGKRPAATNAATPEHGTADVSDEELEKLSCRYCGGSFSSVPTGPIKGPTGKDNYYHYNCQPTTCHKCNTNSPLSKMVGYQGKNYHKDCLPALCAHCSGEVTSSNGAKYGGVSYHTNCYNVLTMVSSGANLGSGTLSFLDSLALSEGGRSTYKGVTEDNAVIVALSSYYTYLNNIKSKTGADYTNLTNTQKSNLAWYEVYCNLTAGYSSGGAKYIITRAKALKDATSDNLLNQNIPLDYDESTLDSPAYYMLTNTAMWTTGGHYISDGNDGTYATLQDALKHGCYLVIEPLMVLQVKKNGGDDAKTDNYTSKICGSYYDLIKAQYVDNGNTDAGHHGFYINGLGRICLYSGSTIPSEDGTKYIMDSSGYDNDTPIKADSVWGLMNYNQWSCLYSLSMHIYSGTKVLPEYKAKVIISKYNSTGQLESTSLKYDNSAEDSEVMAYDLGDEPGYTMLEYTVTSKLPSDEINDKLGALNETVEGLSYEWMIDEVEDDILTTKFEDIQSVNFDDLPKPDEETYERTVYIKYVADPDVINSGHDFSLIEESELTNKVAIAENKFMGHDADYSVSRFNGRLMESTHSIVVSESSIFKDIVNKTNDSYEYDFIATRGVQDPVSLYESVTWAEEIFSIGKNSLFRADNTIGENYLSSSIMIALAREDGVEEADYPETLLGIGIDVYKGLNNRYDYIEPNSTNQRAQVIIGEVTFYPYIKMTIDTMNEEKIPVSVAGQFERTFNPIDTATVSISNRGKLKVTSSMWCIDKIVTQGEEVWKGNNQVLKGGATYTLQDEEKAKLKVTTYQTVMSDADRTYYGLSNDKFNDTTATEKHNDLVTQVYNTIDNSKLTQYVNTDFNKEKAWSSGGLHVYSGSNISSLNNGNSTASTNSKYYLKDSTTYTDSNDIVAAKSATDTKYYKFYADTEGNIYMKKLSSLNDTDLPFNDSNRILTKTQCNEFFTDENHTLTNDIVNNALSNSTAKLLNQNTSIVTKICLALERNTGEDNTAPWASTDGKWYNEAFEGITVSVRTTYITASLDTKRTTVLDPELIPKIADKNSQMTNAFLTQYCLNLNSLQEVGEFNGLKLKLPDMNELLISNKFYITNATVQNSR